MNGGNPVDIPSGVHSLGSVFEHATNPPLNTAPVGFETQNGESIVAYYNPKCVYKGMDGGADNFAVNWDRAFCVNFIYDLNGSKGPNTFGKDIGIITVFHPTDSEIVAPMPEGRDSSSTVFTYEEGISYCRNTEGDSRLPNSYEMDALLLNSNIIGGLDYESYLTGTVGYDPENGYTKSAVCASTVSMENFYEGIFTAHSIRCVKR